VFRKNELEMVTIQYQQMRNWLASFPFVMQEGMWEDLKMTGATLRAKSWNAVSLMPVVAERQLSNVGMPLPTYRNQVAFYDMFGEENGSTNFNIAVTGTSGAGKSFLTQGILRDVLNAGGTPGLSTWGTATRTTVTRPAGFISMALNCALTRSPTLRTLIILLKGLCAC
jgi:conjugal transfer ATP-binding protein TraC